MISLLSYEGKYKHLIDDNLMKFYNYAIGIMPEKTLETYIYGVLRFLDYLKAENIPLDGEISVDKFISNLMKEGKNPATVNTYIYGVEKYLKFLSNNVGINATIKYSQLPKLIMEPKNALTDKQVLQYFKVVDTYFKDPYKTLLKILPLSGLRIKEILNLRLQDVVKTKSGYIIKVLNTKGGKYREVPILTYGNKILSEYLSGWRTKFHIDGVDMLFPKPYKDRIRNKPIAYTSVFKKVKAIGEYMGIKWLTPHSFRATYATKLANSGVNTITIMKLLGHSSPSTTTIYDRPSAEDLSNRIKNIEYKEDNK
jgi:integrase